MARLARKSGILFALVSAVFAADAAGIADEINALKATIASNSVTRATDCRYYKALFVDQCSKAELDAILGRNAAAYRRWIELEPGNPAPHSELGCVYAAAGKWKEAKPELESAVAAGMKLGLLRRAQCRWELANCLWREGDKEGAKRLVAEVAELKWPSWIPAIVHRARYLHRAWTDPDAEFDEFRLPHSVDGKPFPTPQEAKYGEKKISLAKVEVSLKEEGRRKKEEVLNDPIVRLLKRKLTRFGAKFEKGGTKVFIEISPNAPVDKPQGYSLDVAKSSVAIKARSRLGATYGVVSLLQCVERRDGKDGRDGKDEGWPRIRECAIRDWPKCLMRGVTNYWMPGLLEYALFSKMSAVSTMLLRTENGVAEYTLAPLDRERMRIIGERFRAFGIDLYGNTRGMAMRPLVPLSSERTWKNHLAWARFQASCGIGLTFELDDERFPLHPLDLKAAGSGANLDAKYLTRLHREVKKDFPAHKTAFCPPFYWGPDSKPNYPEEREPYLKSLGEFLDKEISVGWSGASVKSDCMKESEVEWEKNLIGRKPVIAHNGDCIGRHHFIEYGADPTGFKESHCSNILDLVDGFFQNTSRYQESPEVWSSMDWCWNPDAHDATTAVRRTDEQLEGPGVYEILRDATPALAYFDKYKFGQPHSELFAEDPDDLSRKLAVAEIAWSNVLKIAKNDGLFVGDFDRFGLKFARNIVEYRRNPPEWLVKQHEAAMAATSFAEKEAGFDKAAGDQFLPAAAMSGGKYYEGIEDWTKRGKRNVKYVANGTTLSGSFECDPFPPKRPPRVVICARSARVEPPVIEVEVNGRVVFRDLAFKAYYFTNLEFELPFDALARNNKLVIRPVPTPDGDSKPFPIVHYVVIRR